MYSYVLRDTVSAAASWTSEKVFLADLKVFAISVDFSGSNVVGTLKLQASIDGSVWVDIAGSSQAVTASADHMWAAEGAGYPYVRVDWTYTSGTGNMTVKAILKQDVVTGA